MKFFGYDAEDLTSEKPLTLREATIVTESIEEIDSLIEFLQFVKHEHLKVNRELENMSVHTHYRDLTEAFHPNGDLIIVTETEKKEEECPADETVEFLDKINSDEYQELSDPEKLELLLDLFNRFDDNERIAVQVSREIFYKLDLPDEKKKPHLLKVCDRILVYSADPVQRRNARMMMAVICDEDEFEDLYKYSSPKEYNEAMEHRFFCKNEKERALEFHYATNIDSFIELILHTMRNIYDRKSDIACLKEGIKALEALGDGVVPPAWMSIYAHLHAELACDAAIEQDCGTAVEYLTKYLAIKEKLSKIKDGDILDYGNKLLFGDITEKAVLIRVDGQPVIMSSDIQSSHGAPRHLSPAEIFHPESLLHYFNEEKNFFVLRGDERFEAMKKRAHKLAEDWVKENE